MVWITYWHSLVYSQVSRAGPPACLWHPPGDDQSRLALLPATKCFHPTSLIPASCGTIPSPFRSPGIVVGQQTVGKEPDRFAWLRSACHRLTHHVPAPGGWLEEQTHRLRYFLGKGNKADVFGASQRDPLHLDQPALLPALPEGLARAPHFTK